MKDKLTMKNQVFFININISILSVSAKIIPNIRLLISRLSPIRLILSTALNTQRNPDIGYEYT